MSSLTWLMMSSVNSISSLRIYCIQDKLYSAQRPQKKYPMKILTMENKINLMAIQNLFTNNKHNNPFISRMKIKGIKDFTLGITLSYIKEEDFSKPQLIYLVVFQNKLIGRQKGWWLRLRTKNVAILVMFFPLMQL